MVFKNNRKKTSMAENSMAENSMAENSIAESSIAYHCIKFLKSEEVKKEMSSIINPIMDYFLKQIHIYLYFFLFFIFISFVLHLGVLFLLLKYNIRFKKLYNKLNKLQ